jgi:hypothetical protein
MTPYCGATDDRFLCSEPAGHSDNHKATVRGAVVAEWLNGAPWAGPSPSAEECAAIRDRAEYVDSPAYQQDIPIGVVAQDVCWLLAALDEAEARCATLQAKAWDEGKRAGIEQMRPTNPYRATLAEPDDKDAS